MEPVTTSPALPESSDIDRVTGNLLSCGYIILPGILTAAVIGDLLALLHSLDESLFSPAGIGRDARLHLNTNIRTDEVLWLDPSQKAVKPYLNWMETLRLELNQKLFLGLFDYECHFARYPAGAYYRKHRDAFSNGRNRVVSTVLYLNREWKAGDGGELILYDAEGELVLEKINPTLGKMVLFLSEEFPHEVLPTRKQRFSLSGWFRVNTTGNVADPPR